MTKSLPKQMPQAVNRSLLVCLINQARHADATHRCSRRYTSKPDTQSAINWKEL